MAITTQCQTPGAWFDTYVNARGVGVEVKFPVVKNITEEDAELIEANLHNAVELVLAPYFK